MWYRRYCTARKAREGTHKVDHHDSHCTQDEAYHTASQAPFRRTTWQQKLNYMHCKGYIRESKHALRVPHVEEVELGCSFEFGVCFQKTVTF